MCICSGYAGDNVLQTQGTTPDRRRTEEVMVEMLRQDLGIEVNAQAWRMFLRERWTRFAPLAARIHEGKR